MNNDSQQNCGCMTVMGSKGIRITAVLALAALALFLFVKFVDAAQNLGRSDIPVQETVTVEGTGKITAVPDIARINFSVTETATTVGVAQDAATKKMNAAIAYLKEAKIAEKDIKTTSYNVNPKYDYSACYNGNCPAPKIIGYDVSQSVEVKVRDTSKAGEILQGLGSRNVQNISGPSFSVDDPDALRSDARGKAIADAREKAKILAKQLGVRLGKVVNFYESGGPIMYANDARGMGVSSTKEMAPAPELPVGENEYSVNVSIVYEIR
jgi:uncharacterized protein YggE